jgi:hypothetical protein
MVVNLSLSLGIQGIFFNDVRSPEKRYNYFILPLKGIYYQTSDQVYTQRPTKLVFDLRKPPVAGAQIIDMSYLSDGFLSVPSGMDFINVGSVQCNTIFYIRYEGVEAMEKFLPYLMKSEECSQNFERYAVRVERSILSSKYICKYLEPSSVRIRNISSLESSFQMKIMTSILRSGHLQI